MPKIDHLFEQLIAWHGSDLHLNEGEPPKIRIHGDIHPLDLPVLTRETVTEYLSEIAGAERWNTFIKTHDLDFAYEMRQGVRFRINLYRHLHGFGAVMRLIPDKINTIEDLHLPPIIREFANLRSGLVLVTGPTGSGKSTTLAALIDHINEHYAKHIITIEEPIEFVHVNKQSIITQREVGIDAKSFAAALRVARREDPDVILVGEMRDLETISMAVGAAEQGVLVYGTLHTNSAIKTVDRIIDVFPVDQQPLIRSMLAASLKGVCAQLLIKRADGQGRLPVNEILRGSTALSNVIREGATMKIHDIIKLGAEDGMQLMDDSIFARMEAGEITPHDAYMKSTNQARFRPYLDEQERRAEEEAAEEAARQVRLARGKHGDKSQ